MINFKEKLKHKWEQKEKLPPAISAEAVILDKEQSKEFVRQVKEELWTLRERCLEKVLKGKE